MPTIEVTNEDALVDEVITITVKCLEKNERVTVKAEVIEKGQVFAGSGCFVADDTGTVDLSIHPSTGGTYQGVSPMGLFWSMRTSPNTPKGIRLIKNNASSPLVTELSVFSGLLSFEQTFANNLKPVVKKKIRRWYMGKDVQKIPVRSGRVRGTLFLPPGRGPFPGVIDMFGMVGSCSEFRAALFASRGFAALALPYYLYDDLPRNLGDVEMEYFMEAIEWMSSHPHVDGNNLGAIGVSKGGEIALQMSYYSDKIKAVVSINGAPFLTVLPMSYKGEVIGQSIKHLVELHAYPGAGHLIDPPYAPLPRSTTRYNRGTIGEERTYLILWGGETVGHAHGQEDSWRHILRHFRTTLSASPTYKEDQKNSKL